jgi:hypothetical protein
MNGITSFNLDLGYLILLKIFRICIQLSFCSKYLINYNFIKYITIYSNKINNNNNRFTFIYFINKGEHLSKYINF